MFHPFVFFLSCPARNRSRLTPNTALAAASLLSALLAGISPARAQVADQKAWLSPTVTSPVIGKRVALVVGNTHYGGHNSLRNPENDAHAMAKALQGLGFEVLMCTDRSNQEMDEDIEDFGKKIENADVALFYFSGHGSQVQGANYLLPVGFDGHSEGDIKYEAVDVDRVLDTLRDAKSHGNIVILDACRDNPFSKGTRSITTGLAKLATPEGILIAYATAPGSTAEDNPNGANGLYTEELLRQIKVPDQRIEDVFMNTGSAVRKLSDGKQVPWKSSSLEGTFTLAPAAILGTANPAATPEPVVVTPTPAPPVVVAPPAPTTGVVVAPTPEPIPAVVTPPPVAPTPAPVVAEPTVTTTPVSTGADKPLITTDEVKITTLIVPAPTAPAVPEAPVVAAVVEAPALPTPAVVHVLPKTLRGHTDHIDSAAYSPDNKWIVTGSKDNTAKVWDAATGREVRTLRGHSGVVHGAAFSPDNRYVVTASLDRTVKIWDAATGTEVRTLNGHTDGVISASYSPDGAFIVTGSSDNTARVWDTATGNEIRVLIAHASAVMAASYSPDGAFIVTGSNDGTAKIWNAATGQEVRTLTGHTRGIESVSFSPDGKSIVTGSYDGTAKIWDVQTGGEIRSLTGHSGGVWSAAFSPDGKSVVTGSKDNTAKIWDVQTGVAVRTLRGHTDVVPAACFSSDSKYVLTGSFDGTARVWDAATGECSAP